ncbi:hypothetical protein EDF62_0236 [Leucobacter luti]|uniref:Uncharacterized protein n=1 Tax=Leucobacter luti TaxID=340320 RepID=A0A4R6S8B8_9MICO|nr:hypothetical protein EDF62_0236 [Leucobacter luti]
MAFPAGLHLSFSDCSDLLDYTPNLQDHIS